MPNSEEMNDEQRAREILKELYKDSSWAQAARDTHIEERTMLRISKGSGIKAPNWVLLHAYQPFEERFQKAKKASEPQLDRATKESMGRLARAMGPRLLKLVAVELEDLVAITDGEKALSAIERLAETAREVAESARESGSRQKD